MLEPGDDFAGYSILRAIGPGRWGELYLAQAPRQLRQVVLEVLPTGATAELESHERFTVAASGQFQGRHWLEYVDGADAVIPAGPAVNVPTAAVVPPAERSPRRRGTLIAAGALTAVAVAPVAILVGVDRGRTPADPEPGLDGTYRFVYDDARQTANGAPSPSPLPPSSRPDVSVTAFRSTCATATGCVATGTKLDPNNPNAELNRWHSRRHPQRPIAATVWRFADGAWELSPPFRYQSDEQRCLGADGTIGAGSDTAVTSKSLQPQSDGTLRGVETTTILTNECGFEGQVYQVPFTVTRIGDVSPDVAVTDPAEVPAPAPTSIPESPASSPALNGTYRIDVTGPNSTRVETRWWAVRSECVLSRCVATAAPLTGDGGKPAGGAAVLRFGDERWHSGPALLTAQPCASGTGAAAQTRSLSLAPQPDGSLRGTQTVTVLTNECGTQGKVSEVPIVATRAGDVPPSVVLADPTLFL